MGLRLVDTRVWWTIMPVWTCPNIKCTFGRQLQRGQRCPICGEEAGEFEFREFGTLLKVKRNNKTSADRKTECKKVLDRVKYCPTCGSTKIFWASGFPQFWSLWECRECGYKGALVLEDGKIAVKLRKEWNEKRKKEKEE